MKTWFITYQEYIAYKDLDPLAYTATEYKMITTNEIINIFPPDWLVQEKEKGRKIVLLFWQKIDEN